MSAIAALIVENQAKPKSDSPKLESPLASQVADLHSRLAALQADYDLLCAELRDMAREQLQSATSVDVTDGASRVQIIRSGQFKSIPAPAIVALQESLGRHFDALFVEQSKVSVRDLAGLLEHCPDAGQYLDIKTSHAPVKGYYQRKSGLPLTASQYEDLGAMEQLCEYSYRVVVK